MPAHPIPAYTPVPFDNFFVDDEFDMFDIATPYNRRADIKKPKLLCDEAFFDDLNDDELIS